MRAYNCPKSIKRYLDPNYVDSSNIKPQMSQLTIKYRLTSKSHSSNSISIQFKFDPHLPHQIINFLNRFLSYLPPSIINFHVKSSQSSTDSVALSSSICPVLNFTSNFLPTPLQSNNSDCGIFVICLQEMLFRYHAQCIWNNSDLPSAINPKNNFTSLSINIPHTHLSFTQFFRSIFDIFYIYSSPIARCPDPIFTFPKKSNNYPLTLTSPPRLDSDQLLIPLHHALTNISLTSNMRVFLREIIELTNFYMNPK
jgi:hypothetical protein